ncbi:MAG: 3'-5' exonuclease [Clostridia bacterium]|nr:3'-5' exonuclease [Clostridia bacterium]
MKYLFFDIECAGVSKNAAKICAFGYCLTDEQFNIIEKNDILINPQGRFHLTDRKGRRGLVLPYEYAEFKNYPVFPKIVRRIRELLQDKNTLVLGHATANDVKYLTLEAKRFSLKSFEFAYGDTQFLYMNAINDFSRQYGLGAIAENLNVEFVAHRAVDDAYATMRVAEALCKAEQKTLPELFEKYEITLGSVRDYEITYCESTAHKNYVAEVARKKELREKNRARLHVFIDKERRKRNKKGGLLKNSLVCFSHLVEDDFETGKRLAVKVFANGAFITGKAEECDLYVYAEGENGQRLKSAMERNAKLMTASELEEYLAGK